MVTASSTIVSAASSNISAASSNISAASSNISAASVTISATTTPTATEEAKVTGETKTTEETKPTEKTKPTDKPTTRPQDEPSGKFKDIANVTITDENVVEVVNQLENLTSEGDMNGGDTKVALEILQKITSNNSLLPKDKSGRKKMGQSIVQVASSLLSKKNAGNWGIPTEKENNTDKATSQTQVLEVIEHIGLLIGEKLGDNDSLIVESANIAMGVETKIPDKSSPGAEYPRYDELGSEWRGRDRVFVHRKFFDEMAADKSSRTTVVYAIYNQVSEHFPANTINDQSSESLIVNSRILALKFNKQLTTPLKTPIKLWFDKLEKGKNVTKPSCSFVDFKSARGLWSHKGCHVVKEKDKDVECACDHLTNFAILMQVKEFEIEPDHYKALTVITYVGCGVSLFGLALTLATFLSLETLASERTSIHKNLVVAIGLAQIIFLAGIDATYNPIACKAVALFLHYLYTAAFTWMLCEGIHLYSKVVEVFSEGSKMKYYYALGWGLPLTIVFISACSRWGGYGNERACWISITDGLIWAFVAPVLIVMTINFVVMIMVIRVIIASVTSLQNPGNASQVRAGVNGMIVLLPLLGLTWVFGLLAINKDTIAFQYLFAILNSLQGLFIFAFHCIGNTEVRVAYKRLHEKRTLAKSLPEHSLSSTHHMSSRPLKKRMDSHETNFTGDDDIIVTKSIRSVSDVKICGDNMALQTIHRPGSHKTSMRSTSTQYSTHTEFSEQLRPLTKEGRQHRKSSSHEKTFFHNFRPKVLGSCSIV
ncbi:adhesion G protein-coupled receptor L1-like isoform X1 [Stylophora pistillata]|nr:adhesion G protein-coupled receptor L1-like isoform X1 [Stylophora pistillata]